MQQWIRRLAALAGLAAAGAQATEGGGNSYPIGVETQRPGLMAPEGDHWFVYVQHYAAGRYRDNAGRAPAAFARFALHADVLALRYSHVWRGLRIAGATVETRIVQPLADAGLSLAVARPPPLAPLDRDGSHAGLADTAIVPFVLGWHGTAWHQAVGLDTHVPWGGYDAARRVNTGRNYWQAAPFHAFTWLAASGWEASGKLRYAWNGANGATHYRSGREASLEFSAGYRFTAAFGAGLNGYVYRQVSDDVANGAPVNGDGNRGRVNALGPYLQYSVAPGFAVIGKVQREWDARNRPEGTRVWLQARIPW